MNIQRQENKNIRKKSLSCLENVYFTQQTLSIKISLYPVFNLIVTLSFIDRISFSFTSIILFLPHVFFVSQDRSKHTNTSLGKRSIPKQGSVDAQVRAGSGRLTPGLLGSRGFQTVFPTNTNKVLFHVLTFPHFSN